MKILTVCHAGNVRSVALAWLLKEKGHQAIAAGVKTSTPQTLDYLADWAEKVIALQPSIKQNLPFKAKRKAIVFDVGPDVWKDPTKPTLRKKLQELIDQHDL